MAEKKFENLCTPEERQEILELLPQKPPFLFVDEILELSDEHIVGCYRFRKDEMFYKGHFPGFPVTPGVIMVEAMAQVGVTAFGIYVYQKSGMDVKNALSLFTECEVEFNAQVPPESKVMLYGEKLYYRRNKVRSAVRLTLEDGTVAAEGTVAGMGIPKKQT